MFITLSVGDFLYDYEAIAPVTLNRSLEELPSLSGVQITFPFSQLGTVRNALRKGNTITILGKPWRISSWQLTQKHRYRDDFTLAIEVVSPFAEFSSGIKSKICYLDVPTNVKPLLANGLLNLENIVDYSGVKPYYIPYGIVDDETLRITPRELLEKYKRRLNEYGGFIFWGGSIPEFRAWGRTTLHTFPSELLTTNDETVWSEPGNGAIVDGVQLVKEIVHLEFKPDRNESVKYDECFVTTEGIHADTITKDEFELEGFRGPANCFDAGGITKERITSRFCNGSLMWRRVEKFGFVYASCNSTESNYASDYTYEIIQYKNPNEPRYIEMKWIVSSINYPTWQKFEDTTETYYYNNPGDRYLKKVERHGWKLFRFKAETSKNEAVSYQMNILAAKTELEIELIKKTINLYAVFYRQNIENDYTLYDFTPLAKYYKDITPTAENPYLFCSRETRVFDWFQSITDVEAILERYYEFYAGADENAGSFRYPDSSTFTKITAGERYSYVKETEVVVPFSIEDHRTIEKFRERKRETHVEGESLKDRIEISPETEQEGRPSEHTRLTWYGWTKDQLPEILKIPDQKKLILDSPGTGYLPEEPPLGDWSSPGVFYNEDAIAACELELSIDNTIACRTTTLKIPTDLSINEGDLLTTNGELFVVLEISAEFEIREGIAVSDLMEVKIGKLMAFSTTWVANYSTVVNAVNAYLTDNPTATYPAVPPNVAPTVNQADYKPVSSEISLVLSDEIGSGVNPIIIPLVNLSFIYSDEIGSGAFVLGFDYVNPDEIGSGVLGLSVVDFYAVRSDEIGSGTVAIASGILGENSYTDTDEIGSGGYSIDWINSMENSYIDTDEIGSGIILQSQLMLTLSYPDADEIGTGAIDIIKHLYDVSLVLPNEIGSGVIVI